MQRSCGFHIAALSTKCSRSKAIKSIRHGENPTELKHTPSMLREVANESEQPQLEAESVRAGLADYHDLNLR